jgi:peptidoglycan/xylan/chitin deacetylase (PgdA/CDA1 family)
LTFDDGFKEHYRDVTPILSEARIQGAFFLITGCIEDERVAAVHMNHFLMASLDFAFYRRALVNIVKDLDRDAPNPENVAVATATRNYIWDTPDVACFKFWFNFALKPEVRDSAVRELFLKHIGEERKFARELYLTWAEAREMCTAGMALGGHSHQHKALSSVPENELTWDLSRCRQLLDERLGRQELMPFSYPFGKRESYSAQTVAKLRDLAFSCSFSTEVGDNRPGAGLFSVARLDCKKAIKARGVQ